MSSTITPQQQTVADQPSDWSQTLPFAQFDPSLGSLDGIGVSLTGDVLGTVSIESLEAAPSAVTVALDGTVSVSSPTDVLMAQVSPEAFAAASLATDASTILSGISAAASAQALLQPGSVDLGNFVGTGSVPLTVAATSQLEVAGPANMEVASQASAGATVVLQFDFSMLGAGSNNDFYGSTYTSDYAPTLDFYPGPVTSTTPPQTFSFLDQTTGWTNSVPVLPFDSSLGILEAITLSLTGNEAASVEAENEDTTAATLSTTQTATLNLDLPDGTTAVSAASTISASMSLGGYDGTADFSGASGGIDQGLTQTTTASVTLTDPAGLSLFSGSGTVALPLSAIGTSTLDGPGNLLARLLAQAGATVSVSYTYAPWTQVTWTNLAGGDWDTGTGWSSSPAAPATDDAVEITQAGTYTITLDTAQSVESVLLDAPGAVVVLDAPLTVAAGFTLEAGTLEFNGGSLSVGSYEQDGGLAAGGTINIVASGAIDLNAGTIDGSNVTLTAGSSIGVFLTAAIATGTVGPNPGSLATQGSIVPIGSLVIDNLGNPLTPADFAAAPPITWTNAAGGDWSAGTNWSSSPNPPGSGADVEFNLPGTYTVTIDVATAPGVLTLDDPGLTLQDGDITTVGTILLDAGTLDLNAVLSGTTILANGGTVTGTQGEFDGGTIVGTLILTGGTALDISGGLTATQADGVSPGEIESIGSAADIGFKGTQTLDNLDLVNLNLSGVRTSATDPVLTLGSHTTIDVTTSSDFDSGTLVSDGTIAVQSGATLSIFDYEEHQFLNNGTMTLAAGSTLHLSGYYATGDLGNFSNAGGLISVDGVLDNTGGTLVIAPGAAFGDLDMELSSTLVGGTVLDQGGMVDLYGVYLSNLTWRGLLDLSHDSVTLQDVTVQAANGGAGSITLDVSAMYLNGGGTLDNVTITASGTADTIDNQAYYGGGPVVFGSSLTVDATTGGTALNFFGASLTNNGQINVAGTGEVAWADETSFINAGQVTVSNGAVFQVAALPGSFANAGNFVIGSGGTLQIGAYETAFVNTGTITLTDASSTLELDGTAVGLGMLTGGGGRLIVAGLLDNTSQTLDIESSGSIGILQLGTGGWEFGHTSGVILGGTIAAQAGTVLFDGGTLDDVTWEGPLTVGGANSEFLQIENGLHVLPAAEGPAVLALTGTSFAEVNFLDAETLTNLAITASATNSQISDNGTLSFGASTTLTLAAGSGEAITLGGGSFSNAGLISDTLETGSTITVTGTSFVNSGSIAISGAGSVLMLQTGSFLNTGEVTVSDGATLYLGAPILPADDVQPPESSGNTGTISLDATSTLVVGGTVTTATLASIQTAGGLVELAGTLVNAGSTITLAAGSNFGNLQIGGTIDGAPIVGDIQGGTVVEQSDSLTLQVAVLDGVTWHGLLDLGGPNDSLTILDGITLLPLSGPGQGTIDLTGVNSSLDFEFGTLSNALVNLGAVSGSVSFGDPTEFVILAPDGSIAALTLAASTTLSAMTAGAGTISLGGNIANLGLIDDAQGDVALGTFSPPPIVVSDPGPGGVVIIDPGLQPPPTTFDNQGTIVAAAGTGSNFTIGDETTFSNEGLIQVANDDDLIVLTSTFANTGTLSIAAGSTVEFAGTVGNIGTIAFAGTGGELRLDLPNGVTGTLLNWSIGDQIVLPAAPGYAVAVNNGTLDLSQNGTLLSAFIVDSSNDASDFPLSVVSGDIVIGAPVVSWANGSGGDWGNPANWSSNPTEPGATTDVAITLPGTYGVTVNDSRAINSLLLDNAGAALTVNGTLSIADTAAFEAGSVTVNGTLAAADAAAIVANAVTLSTDLGFGTAAIDASLDNTGLVQVNSGTLSLNGGGSSSASGLQAAANAVLEFGGTAGTVESTFSLTGGLYQGLDTVISGSTLDASAASGVVFGTLQLSASGELLLGGNNAQADDGFTQETTGPGGVTGTPFLWGTGTFTVYGGANLIGGQELDTGLTRLFGLSAIGGADGFSIEDGRTVENDGWLNWSSGNIQVGNTDAPIYPLTMAGTLDNVAGATFYITALKGRIANGVGGVVDNAGVIAVFVGGSSVAFADPVYNTGYIQVQSGVLALNDGGSSDASNLYVAPGAELQFGLANRVVGQPAGPSTFTLTGGDFVASDVLINGTTVDATAVSDVTLGMLRVAGSGALLLGSGDAQIDGAFLQGPTTDLNATGVPFLSGTGTLTVYGGGSLINGVESGSGLTRLIGSSQIGGSPAFELDGGRTVENDGWMTWSSGDIVLGAGDASAATQSGTIGNVSGATFYITADGLIGNQGDGTGKLNNAGVTAVFAGIGATDIDAYVDNTGFLQVQSGTLSLNGGGNSAGANLFAASDAVVQFGTLASGLAGGVFAITSGQYTVADTAITGGTLDVSAAGDAVFVNRLDITAGELQLGSLSGAVDQGVLEQSGGLLTGSGLFTVYGGAALAGGVQTGPATTRLYGTSVIGGSIQLDGGRTVENDGWMNWSSGNIALGSGDPSAATQTGTLTNAAGAVFYVTSDGLIGSSGASGGTLNNAGVLAVFAGAGETDIDATVNDTGFIQVQSGTLGLNGGGTANAGNLFVAANAVVQFGTMAATGSGGTFVFNGGPYIAGNTVVNGSTVDVSAVSGVSFGSSLTVNSGALVLGGNFPSVQDFVQTGGELSGTGTFAVASAAELTGGLETGGGLTDLQGGGSIDGPVSFDGGRSLENDGTLTWTDGSITLGGGDTSASDHSAALINSGVLSIETAGTINGAGFSGSGVISNTGTILSYGFGTTSVFASLFNDGVVEADAGTLALQQGVGGTGTFLLNGGATLDFVNGAGSSATMQFLHSGGTLETLVPGTFGPAISGFAAGDVIDAGAIGFVTGTTEAGFNAGTLTVSEGAQSAAFVLAGSYDPTGFHIIGSDGHGGT